MLDKIKNLAATEFNSYSLRITDAGKWDNILNNSKYVPIDYTHETLNYRVKFLEENNKKVIDFSIIINDRNISVAVWAISISLNKNYEISCFGREIKEPIFINDIQEKDKENIIKKCFSFLKQLSSILEVKEMKVSAPFHSKNLNYWSENCLELSANTRLKYNLYLNLNREKTEIVKSFRTVYRNYHNSWKKKKFDNYAPRILKNDNSELWSKFKKLHEIETGRITRSNKTWGIHYENIIKKKAFLSYIAHKETNEILGGAYFALSKDEAYYGVGKYSKKYKKEKIPLGHLIQFAAIEEMILRKIKVYKIGLFHSQIITNEGLEQKKIIKDNLSHKEKSISYFAKGFASEISPEIIYTISYS